MLRTFGGLAVEDAGFRRLKPLLLLAYLAVEGGTPRRRLARLFFPEAGEPLKALGMSLTRLRQGLPGAAGADEERAWSELPNDVAALRAALAAADLPVARGLYRGAFLDGIEPYKCGPEVEEWLFATRERCAAEWRGALLSAAMAGSATGDWHGAAGLAEEAWLVAGAQQPEPAVATQIHRLLIAGRHPLAAEVADSVDDADLHSDTGLPLDVDTEAARAALRPAVPPTGGASLPPPLASVGRAEEEMALLAALGRGRFVTLTGMAGVGKSHLALRVAWRCLQDDRFPDGVHAVSLAAVKEPSAVLPAIAETLRLRPTPGRDARSVVMAHLADRRSLLLLDNLEQLLALTPDLRALLTACPQLHLLITSRSRLGLNEEEVVTLGGLPTPDLVASGAESRDNDAVRLFLSRASRVAPWVSFDDDAVATVAEACRLLEGLPLAIELAASWLRLLPPRQLLEEVADAAKLLLKDSTSELRGAFERSWARLGPDEAKVLRDLAVFQGGFDRVAAEEVAEAGLDHLASLSDASLLRAQPDGRFDQHPLLAAFGKARLEASGAMDEVADRHAAHFLTGEGAEVATVGDAENLRAAWLRATATSRLELLADGVAPLERVFMHRPSELAALLEATLTWLGAPDPGQEPGRDAVELRLRLALVPPLMSTQGYASPNVAASLARAQRLGSAATTGPEVFPALWGLWGFHVVRGAMSDARELAATCERLPLADQPWLLAECQRMVAESDLWSGRFLPAQARYLRALTQLPGDAASPAFLQGHHPGVTMRSALALCLWCTGASEEAFSTSREALATAERLGHPYGVAYALTLSAVLGCMARDHPWTLEHASQAEELSNANGFAHWAAVGALLQGWVACREGETAAGSLRLQAGLDAWRGTGAGHSLPFFLALSAESQGLRGLHRQAIATLDAGLDLAEEHDEHWWSPELWRLRAEALTMLGEVEEASHDLRRAKELAAAAGAKGWGARVEASSVSLDGLRRRPA